MTLNYNKDGLIPAIIQDVTTREVLMLGYMNAEAYAETLRTKKVTFYSRKRQQLWTKGEESGNYLNVVTIRNDCDDDTLLIQANPIGATCHKGTLTCWGNPTRANVGQLTKLENTIENRINQPKAGSYISNLTKQGINKVAQKVGEEAVEMIIEAKDSSTDLFLNESADLLFHYLLLLHVKGFALKDVLSILKEREQ